ncbi:MAG: hypothetical protein ORN85_06780 [Sediminibacterium sp.]|nr:hypothetical protein [Sediminibacterium sp.]
MGYDYIESNHGPTAKIWKNGIGTLLSNFDNASEANSIYVIDNDVYVVGSKSYFKGYGFEDVATVWKNGKEVALYADNSEAKSVFVTNK